MSVLGREQVEFKAIGLKELIDQAKELENQTKATREANRKLNRSLADGSYVRAAKDYDKAARALREVRREQSLIAAQIRRDDLMRKYGRVGGLGAYYGGAAMSRLGGAGRALGGAGSSLLGGAAALGATVSVGALASRGFSGTAAAAKLDQSFERLSRSVATDLLPAMDALSNIISKISNARENVRAGKGTLGDHATSIASDALLYGGSALAIGKLMGFSAGGMLGGAVGAAGRLGKFALSGPGAMVLGGAAAMYEGSKLGSQQDRLNALQSVGIKGGKRHYFEQFTDEEFGRVRGLVDEVRGISDPTARKKRIGELQDANRADIAGHDDLINRSALNPRWLMNYEGDQQKRSDLRLRKAALSRLKLEAEGGEAFTTKGSNNMMLVQGAGERRSSGELFEELSSATAKLIGTQQGESTGNGPLSIAKELTNLASIGERIGKGLGLPGF